MCGQSEHTEVLCRMPDEQGFLVPGCRQLMTGHVNLVNQSMPVKMFEPRSYLQKLSDVWVHSGILSSAAACSDSTLRLKWVVTWCVSRQSCVQPDKFECMWRALLRADCPAARPKSLR